MSGPEHLEHAPGAGAEIKQRAKRLVGKRGADRILHRFVGDVQLADAIPFRGMRAEISLRGGGARLPYGSEPVAIARDRLVGRIEALDQRARNFGAPAMFGQPEEGPGALAETLDQAGFSQQLEVARDARLRLAQDIGEVGDGQLGLGKEGQHAQARFLARCLERRIEGIKPKLAGIGHRILEIGRLWAVSHHIKISLYVETPSASPLWQASRGLVSDRFAPEGLVPGPSFCCSWLKARVSRAKEQI